MPIEEALLIATMTQALHTETGGNCHDLDVPPLAVSYVIEHNHNYSNMSISPVVGDLLGDILGEEVTSLSMLDKITKLKEALECEVSAQGLHGIEFIS